MQNAVFQCQVLLGCALGQHGRPWHDARLLLDHFVAGELLAGQVYLRSIWKAIPPVDSLSAAISAVVSHWPRAGFATLSGHAA
jgi:hypothetical protein